MTEQEVDIELLKSNSITDRDLRASVLESILREFKVKYIKEYAFTDNRYARKSERVYTEDEDTTIIYSFKCIDSTYNFIVYLFKERITKLEKIITAYEKRLAS